jgi:hypothetical protein
VATPGSDESGENSNIQYGSLPASYPNGELNQVFGIGLSRSLADLNPQVNFGNPGGLNRKAASQFRCVANAFRDSDAALRVRHFGCRQRLMAMAW